MEGVFCLMSTFLGRVWKLHIRELRGFYISKIGELDGTRINVDISRA